MNSSLKAYLPTLSSAATAIIALIAAHSTSLPVSAQSSPCATGSRSAVAALAGDYTLQQDGQTVGQARLSAVAGGCGLEQRLTLGQFAIESTLYMDPADQTWHELTLVDNGSVARGAGAATVERGQLTALSTSGEVSQADGSSNRYRSKYSRTESGQLRQHVELSQDGAWTRVYDVVFVRPGDAPQPRITERAPRSTAAPPAPPAPRTATSAPRPAVNQQSAAAPAPDTASSTEGSRVRVRSAAADERPDEAASRLRSRTRVAKVSVESPMLVELPLGPIDKLPSGYSWRSKDLAQYQVEGGTIEEVEVQRKTRRGKTTLVVTFYGQSQAFTAEFAISAHLEKADGTRISESGETKLYTGRTVTSQVTDGVSSTSIELVIDKQAFDEAFAGETRPHLDIRVEALG